MNYSRIVRGAARFDSRLRIILLSSITAMFSVAFGLGIWPRGVAAQSSSANQVGSTTVEGTIRDSAGTPVADAFVFLEEKGGARLVKVQTHTDGHFAFSLKQAGTFNIRAEKPGVGSAKAATIQLESGQVNRFDLVLTAAAPNSARAGTPQSSGAGAGAMEFADEPNFTVAGVTDWSNAGLHGSDVRARTSDALARETLALKPSEATKGRAASPNAHYNLALEYRAKGDFAHAREEARKNLAASDTADGHRLLGDLDERLSEPLEAVREFERAARMEASEQNYFDWATELLLHKAPQAAAEVFRKGSVAHPDSTRLLAGWGVALYATGSYEDAARRLCAASDLKPTDPAPYLFLGEMENSSPESWPCSEERLARFVRTQPDDAMANYYYAMTLWKRRRESQPSAGPPEAEPLLEKAVKINPKLTEAYVQLGVLRAARGDLASAIAAYQQALAVDSRSSDAHYRLSLAYKRTGENEKAHQEYETYRQLKAADADAVERQRRQLRQFVITLKGQPDPPTKSTP